MLAVGGAVFTVTPAGGFGRVSTDRVASAASSSESSSAPADSSRPVDVRGAADAGTSFLVQSALDLEGRVGHAAVLASSPEETYVMLEVRGDDAVKATPPTVALSLVVDKSGSMSSRFANTLQAAVLAVERLHDGDSVSVVAFDTRSQKVVPLTTLNSSTRQSVIQAIRGIRLGGDTCISCGIEDGLSDLRNAQSLVSPGTTVVQRMIVLSDGKTNNGITDVGAFKSLGGRAISQGVNIATIGLDVDFDEKVMSAIAASSNGHHYFAETDADLARIFETEAQSVTASVANNAVAEIELAPGVELVRVFDRSFNRNGSRLTVPLGAFAKGDLKTVLVKIRVPRGDVGNMDVASVRLTYRDVTTEKDAVSTGKLSLKLVGSKDEIEPIDALVLDRLQRSETAAALRDANNLFTVGKVEEARKRLDGQSAALASARPMAKPAPKNRAGDLDSSFNKQEEELKRSRDNFSLPAKPSPEPQSGTGNASPSPAPPAAADRAQKTQVKRNMEQSQQMME